MSDPKPLVLKYDTTTGNVGTSQLQSGDDLDLPINDRIKRLEIVVRELGLYLLGVGFSLPEDVIKMCEEQ